MYLVPLAPSDVRFSHTAARCTRLGGCQVDQNTTKSMFLSKVLSATASRSTTALRFHSTAAGSTSPFLKDFITSEDKGPVETAIESKVGGGRLLGWLVAMQVVNALIKLIEALDPSTLHIVNESHMHAHHAAMKGNTNKETHFRWVTLCMLTSPISHLHCYSITLISEKFAGQVKKKKGELRKRIKRRMINMECGDRLWCNAIDRFTSYSRMNSNKACMLLLWEQRHKARLKRNKLLRYTFILWFLIVYFFLSNKCSLGGWINIHLQWYTIRQRCTLLFLYSIKMHKYRIYYLADMYSVILVCAFLGEGHSGNGWNPGFLLQI